MGYDIPEPYRWDESFATFYQNLDDDHKGLFDGIFDVAAKPDSDANLKTLIDRVAKHFRREEDMMNKAGYPEFASHRELHHDFEKKLGAVSVPVSPDTVHFAKEWLVNHIKGTDHKYKGKLG